MKKSKLLELLAHIPDNGDVYLWNGFVGDWVDIGEVVESTLVKMTQESMRELCRMEECVKAKDWALQHSEEELAEIDKAYKQNYKWEFNQYVTVEDIKSGRYKQKKIFLIDAKKKGESSWDRLGSFEY